MNESQITNVELEQKLNSEQKNNETTESNTIAKPIVGCGASLSTEKAQQIKNANKELDELFLNAPKKNGIPIVSSSKIDEILKRNGYQDATGQQ